MTSDVVLTAALRNNLLSLQNTQKSIDKTQLNLATGRTVNSALDSPQNFFAAQALNNRASDLTRLLDSIGQSIQTIQAADNGVTALTSLVEQADSLANSARDALAAGEAEARVNGSVDLSGVDDLTNLDGIANGDQIFFTVTDENGDSIDLGNFGAGGATATFTVTISTNDSIEDLIANINDNATEAVQNSGTTDGDQIIEASLDDGGNLQLRTLNGGDLQVEFIATGSADADPNNTALANALGFTDIARLVGDGGGNNNVQFTTLAGVQLESFTIYDNNGGDPEIAQASTLLDQLEDEDGNALFGGISALTDELLIGINGETSEVIELYDGNNAVSIQNVVDQINDNTNLSQYIEANYDAETGSLTIRAISAEVASVEIGADDDATINLGFGTYSLTGGGGANIQQESIRFASAAAELAQYETDFDRIREQITELVTNGDTGYRGTNLLDGDDLLTTFNEDRTSSLTTNGVTFTADGLGLSEANFSRISSTEGALAEIRSALEAIRAFGSTLASDLTVIQTRETFTQNTINTLTEGADKLTIADQNEEGAKLLALQTRQQLGVTSLSLASQSQQSILRLF